MNYFDNEAYLEKIASEMGRPYAPGSQASFDEQPPLEQSSARVNAHLDLIRDRIRQLQGLPPTVSGDERSLHLTAAELVNKDDEGAHTWLLDSLQWLAKNPTATIDALFNNRDTRDDDKPEIN